MHKPEYTQKNETNKILWDSEIRTDHQIPASWLAGWLGFDCQKHFYFKLFNLVKQF